MIANEDGLRKATNCVCAVETVRTLKFLKKKIVFNQIKNWQIIATCENDLEIWWLKRKSIKHAFERNK